MHTKYEFIAEWCRNHADIRIDGSYMAAYNEAEAYWEKLAAMDAQEAKYIADTEAPAAKYQKAIRAAEKEYGEALRALGYSEIADERRW